MFDISFLIDLPLGDKWWRNLYHVAKHLGNNKCIEVELMRDSTIIGFSFNVRTNCDHAGTRLQLSLLFLTLHIEYYDGRHWDNENNCYEVYE